MEYINERLPADAKVLFLGEPRAYYCERDFIAATVFDNNPFWVAARGAHSAEELLARAQKLGITHLFLNVNALYSNASRPTVMPKDIVMGKAFGDFWARYLEVVFEDRKKSVGGATTGWLIVYKLLDRPAADPRLSPGNPFRDVLQALQQVPAPPNG